MIKSILDFGYLAKEEEIEKEQKGYGGAVLYSMRAEAAMELERAMSHFEFPPLPKPGKNGFHGEW